jgi:aspartate-semialdehyde dehydrogenase
MSETPRQVVAIVGASGAVGTEILRCLEDRKFPVNEIRLLGSARSAGSHLPYAGSDLIVSQLDETSFAGVDIAFFSAGATVSKTYAPVAVSAGALVVDNSSAFRLDPNVPLVVPEVNGRTLGKHHGIVANPNCVAVIMSMVLNPLHSSVAITRVSAATYQSASGGGAAAMEELRQATAAYLEGTPFIPKVLPHPYAFNLFSHNADVDPESGYNGEELKAIAETRRLLGTPSLPMGITCVRVPVLRAHSIALSVEFETTLEPAEARSILEQAPGVRVVDNRLANHFPMPSEASGGDDVLVGRIRQDLIDPSGHTLSFFVTGDQLLKGAALNAVQIAEQAIKRINS